MHLSNEAALDPCWRQTYQKTVAWSTAVTALSAATRCKPSLPITRALEATLLQLKAGLTPVCAADRNIASSLRGMCAAIQGYTLNLHACLHPYAAFRP